MYKNKSKEKYDKTEKGKTAKRRANIKYKHSLKGKLSRQRYAHGERGHAYRKEEHRMYKKSDKGKATTQKTNRKRRHNMSKEEYNRLFKLQNGLCAICDRPETRVLNGKVVPLGVDHNHQTGENRGLLCHKCNAGIGFLDESPERFWRCREYLSGINPVNALDIIEIEV